MTTTLADRVEQLLAGPRPFPIVTAGHPVLRAVAAHYDGQLANDVLAELIAGMRETMLAAPGVGVAAPQIGLAVRIAVIEDPAEIAAAVATERDRQPLPFDVVINPEYAPSSDERAVFYEGCLSVPGYQAVVDRPAAVRLTAADIHGTVTTREYHGWQARIVQHETDHLDGTLYLDKAYSRSLTDLPTYQALWGTAPVAAAREILGF